MARIEVHFQEGFHGQRVRLMVAGRTVADFLARTRVQTGRAHVETLDLDDGDEVLIRLDDPPLEERVVVDVGKPFVTVYFNDQQLNLHKESRMPGYL